MVYYYKLDELDRRKVNHAFEDALFTVKKIPNFCSIDSFQDMLVGGHTFKRTYVINRILDSVASLNRAYEKLGRPEQVDIQFLINGCNKNAQKYLRKNIHVFGGKKFGERPYTKSYKTYLNPSLYKNGVTDFTTDSTSFEKIMAEISEYRLFEFDKGVLVKAADPVKIRYRIKSMLKTHKSCSRKSIVSKIRTILNSHTIDLNKNTRLYRKIVNEHVIIVKSKNIDIYGVLKNLLINGAKSFHLDNVREEKRHAVLEARNDLMKGRNSVQRRKAVVKKIAVINIDYALRKRLREKALKIHGSKMRETDYECFECLENLVKRLGIFRC